MNGIRNSTAREIGRQTERGTVLLDKSRKINRIRNSTARRIGR
jgi:hypothetical protein